MIVTQLEAQLVAEAMTQCLEHDWLRGQTVRIPWKKVALISTFKNGKRYGKRTVLNCKNIFCACLYRLPFSVSRPYREEEIHLYCWLSKQL